MADIINSVDRSLDMYIYDLYIYIYRYISLSIGLSFSIYFGWPTSLPVWSVQTTKAYSPTMRGGRLPSRSDVNNSAQRCTRLDFLEGQSVSQHLELQRVLKESCAEEGWLDDDKTCSSSNQPSSAQGAEDKPVNGQQVQHLRPAVNCWQVKLRGLSRKFGIPGIGSFRVYGWSFWLKTKDHILHTFLVIFAPGWWLAAGQESPQYKLAWSNQAEIVNGCKAVREPLQMQWLQRCAVSVVAECSEKPHSHGVPFWTKNLVSQDRLSSCGHGA